MCSRTSREAIDRTAQSIGCVTLRSGLPKWTVSACLGHKNGDVAEFYALPTFA
jgi:hypothetical protein